MSHPLVIEHEAVYPHSPERVWRALVDPDALRGWFASDARVTPEVGGEWYVAHGEYGQSSTIDELVDGLVAAGELGDEGAPHGVGDGAEGVGDSRCAGG